MRLIEMKISRILPIIVEWMDHTLKWRNFTNFSHAVQNDNHKQTTTNNNKYYRIRQAIDQRSICVCVCEIISVIYCKQRNNLCNSTFKWLRRFPTISSVIDIVSFYVCILPSTWLYL